MTLTPRLPAALLLLLLAAPALRGARAPEGPTAVSGRAAEPGVIATVNGEAVHFEDLERLLGELHRGASTAGRKPPDLDRLMFRVVNDRLLAQEARALGMQDDEPIPSRLAARRERLAVMQLEQEEIRARAEPTDDEVRRAFEDEYRTITLRIVTVRERDLAEELRKKLEHGADIAALAREHSIDRYKPRDGLIEDLPRIDMPNELAEQAFALKPGDLAGPVPTRIGWANLRVESFADPAPERWETLEPSLRNLVRIRKAEDRRHELGARLREAHPVAVDAEVLASITVERRFDLQLIPKVENPDAVVARVGDRAITVGEFAKPLRTRWTGVQNEEAARSATPIVLERMIREELLRAEALARGFGDTPGARRKLRAFETQLLVSRFLREVVTADVVVTPEEMRAYYEEHKQSLRKPPRLRLGQITVTSEEEAKRIAALLEGGADLAWLARQHSVDEFREAGGDRGWVTPSLTSGGPLGKSLFDAVPGDVLGPEPEGDRFVVVQVGAREEPDLYSFDEISGNIRKAVREQKLQQTIQEFIQTLRSRSEIVIHDDVLAQLRISGSPVEDEEHGGGRPAGPHP